MAGAHFSGVLVKGSHALLVIFKSFNERVKVGGEVWVRGEACGGRAEERKYVAYKQWGKIGFGGFDDKVKKDRGSNAGNFFFKCGTEDASKGKGNVIFTAEHELE